MPVLDASVQIALVNRADGHREAARAWYSRAIADGAEVYAPWILLAEVGAGLSRGLGDPSLAHRAIERIIAEGVVQLVPVDSELAMRAAAIAIEHRIRGCDAVYVALAASLGEALVTFDEQQSARAAGMVPVLRPDAGLGKRA